MQVSLFFYLFFRRIFAAVGFSFYDIKGYMCFFVCQRDVNPVWVAILDGGESLFFSHYDPKTVEWFMSILEKDNGIRFL